MIYLLDTMVVSALLRYELQPVERIQSLSPLTDDVLVSVVTFGEIWCGLREMDPGRRRREREQRARALFLELPLVPVDRDIAEAYAEVKSDLRRRGTPIPEADIWIAATALAHGDVLVTSDAHFSRIPDLHIEDWLRP